MQREQMARPAAPPKGMPIPPLPAPISLPNRSQSNSQLRNSIGIHEFVQRSEEVKQVRGPSFFMPAMFPVFPYKILKIIL